MPSLTFRNGVSILELFLYAPALFVAVFLSIRHGFTRSSGWRFLLLFSLIRILSASFELATISSPKNISLYIGYMILNSIAISPLELTALGLLSRVLSSINKAKTTTVTTRHVKLMETVLTVALVLGIVGGDLASDDYAKTGVYQTHVLSKASIGLMIAAFVGIVLFTLATSREVSSAEAGEKRILLAIAASLPFLLIRIIYSAVYTFTNAKSFSAMSGSVAIMLCMAVIEELVVVWIYLGVGLTLKKATKSEEVSDEYRELGTMTGYQPCGPAAKSVSVEGSRV